jgi:hypothetical protein
MTYAILFVFFFVLLTPEKRPVGTLGAPEIFLSPYRQHPSQGIFGCPQVPTAQIIWLIGIFKLAL